MNTGVGLEVSNFNQISCYYTRIRHRWKIFPKAVSGNGWKLMDWVAGPAAACADVTRGVIMDY